MSKVALTKRTTLETPAATKGFAQFDANRLAWCWVDEFGVAWWFGEQRCKLDADLTGSTVTTLADVTGMAFPVKANMKYDFDFQLIFQVAGSAGIKVALTCPASPTRINASVNFMALKGAPTSDNTARIINASATGVDSATGLDTGVDARARIRGTLINGVNAGTLQLQWAATSAASGAVTPKSGSSGRLWIP